MVRYSDVIFTPDLFGPGIAVNAVDYGTDYVPKIRDANGQYDGIAFHSVTGTTPWRLHRLTATRSERAPRRRSRMRPI